LGIGSLSGLLLQLELQQIIQVLPGESLYANARFLFHLINKAQAIKAKMPGVKKAYTN
jgi:hypothetical protein